MNKSTTTTPADQSAPPTPQPRAVTAIVRDQIETLLKQGRIVFPADYSVENAMASAKLKLVTIENKDKQKIVDANLRPTGVVTEASIINSLFDMCVQGMNVAKNQGYFIVYGNECTFQRSYHGDIALAQRLWPGLEVYTDVVYESETVKLVKRRTRKKGLVTLVDDHDVSSRTTTTGKTARPIIAAYAGGIDTRDGEYLGDIFMDKARIDKSWSKSKTANYDGSTHKTYPDEMSMRTVVRRFCKPIINASSDAILLASVRRQDIDGTMADADEEAAANANGEELRVSTPQLPQASESTQFSQQVAQGQQQQAQEPAKEFIRGQEPTQTPAPKELEF